MDLRTVLIALVVLLCIYIAWLAMRWRRAQQRATAAGAYGDKHAHVFRDVDRFGAIPVGGHADEHPTQIPTLLGDDEDSVVSLSSASASKKSDEPPRMPRPSEPDASGFGFDALLEVRQMRHLVDDLRNQHGKLAEEVSRLREELAAVRAASRVAPAYAEAVSMVRSGLDAQAIAERCGISVAEAELVRALSEQAEHGDEGGANLQQHANRGDVDG